MKAGLKNGVVFLGVILLLTVILCAMFLPAVVVPFANVAIADSLTVENPNLLDYSDFGSSSISSPKMVGITSVSRPSNIIGSWYVSDILSGASCVYPNLGYIVSGGAGTYYHLPSDTLSVGSTYTFSFLSLSKMIPFFMYGHLDSTSHVVIDYKDFKFLHDNENKYLYTYTFTIPDTFDLSKDCFVGFYFDSSSTVYSCKLEVGSIYTGGLTMNLPYEDLQNQYDDLKYKYDDLKDKYDLFVDSGLFTSNLSVNSVSKLSAAILNEDNNPVTYSANRTNVILNRNNSGPLPVSTPDGVYPYDIEYNVLYFNGSYSSINQFNNGNVGLGVTVPITSFNNDLGYVPANADMVFTLNDTFLVSVGGGFTGVHTNVLRFVFYDKNGRLINLTQDSWIAGTNEILNTRGTWQELFGTQISSVPIMFDLPSFGQSYTFNIPVDVYFVGIYMEKPFDTSNYSVGYNLTLNYASEGSTEYLYDLGYRDGANSVNTDYYYDEGYRVGQEIGYANGSKAQGNYTFLGLIGAVIDAPINSFRQMFDFEILGVNMSGFVLSLFSISIILVIIKLVIGR